MSFQSLYMVRDELVATIEQSARDLEMFVASPEDGDSLDACKNGIRQILGILRLLELRGATMMVEELLKVAETVQPGTEVEQQQKPLELVSGAFFVLTRYLEYIQQTEKRIPVLLVPYINEFRKHLGDALLPESFFYPIEAAKQPEIPKVDPISVSETEFRPLLVRLRHMYQLGLLGVLRNKQVPASLGLMRRALTRLQRVGNQQPLSVLWWLANVAVEQMIKQDMQVIEARKLLLSRIDRIIRQVQKGGLAAYQAPAPKGLVKELLYLIVLSGADTPQIASLKQFFGLKDLPYTDAELTRERDALRGPSAGTIKSLISVLTAEINQAKKVLDTAAMGIQAIDDVGALVSTLSQIAETLNVVGLVGPSSTLKTEIADIKTWKSNEEISEDKLDQAAKTLLYLESAVATIDYAADQSGNIDSQSQDEVIALSELARAQEIVLQECDAGLSLCKRAIGAYSESNYDSGHIQNISKTLSTVRGGFFVLRKNRASGVLRSCVEFVDNVLMAKQHPPAMKELLETFADAIISVEYFLDTATIASKLDESVLQVAEESLAALGYPVQSS